MSGELQSLRVPSIRRTPESVKVGANLGLLDRLRGTWEGEGFNLIARPEKEGGSPLFLELNQTFENLSFIPISSSIPNRLHIEPGICIYPHKTQTTARHKASPA